MDAKILELFNTADDGKYIDKYLLKNLKVKLLDENASFVGYIRNAENVVCKWCGGSGNKFIQISKRKRELANCKKCDGTGNDVKLYYYKRYYMNGRYYHVRVYKIPEGKSAVKLQMEMQPKYVSLDDSYTAMLSLLKIYDPPAFERALKNGIHSRQYYTRNKNKIDQITNKQEV
jgi:hypothetical protein